MPETQAQATEPWTLDRVLRAGAGLGLAACVVAFAVAINFDLPQAMPVGLVALGLAWLSAAVGLEVARIRGSVQLWGGLWWARALSWVPFPIAIAVAIATDERSIVELVVLATIGGAAWALLAWIGYLSLALWAVSLAFTLAAVASLVVLVDRVSEAVGVGVGWALLTAVGVVLVRRRMRARKTLVWLAAALEVTQPVPHVFKPSWSDPHGLPLRWTYPESLTPDDRRRGEFNRVFSERLGASAETDWQPKVAIVRRAPEVAQRPAAVVELESALTPMLPGVVVTDLERDEAEKVSKVGFAWPASSTMRASSVAWQRRIGTTIQDAMGQSFTLSFDPANRVGTAVPLTPLPNVVPHPPRDPATPMRVEFGVFRDGRKCVWDLDAPLPHLLINGGTGGGKTVLLLSILLGLPENAIIYGIDPKRLGLFNLHLIPGARPAATREESIVRTLLEVKRLMDERYEYLENNGPHLRKTLAPLVLVIDEGEEMNDLLNDWWVSGDGKLDWKERFALDKMPTGTKHPVMSQLGSILRLGREAKVHVVLASQQASAEWLKTSSRSQFAVRIALRNLEASSSIMLFGSPIATSGLENVSGRAWVSLGMGMQPEHAQVYWTPKLEPGLNNADRAILHGLGITLPDDPGFADTTAENAQDAPGAPQSTPGTVETPEPSEAVTEPATAPVAPSPAQPEPEPDVEPDVDADAADVETVPVGVLELDDGMRIVIDEDGVRLLATVEGVAPDPMDEEYIAVDYRTDEGDLGSLSVRDDETVELLVGVSV